MTHYKGDMHQWLYLLLQSPHNEQSWPLTLWHSSSYLRTEISITLIYNANSDCQITTHMIIFGNGKFFTPHLDRFFIQWNNAVYQINYWVNTAGRYRATSILGRVHAAFFNSHEIKALIYLPDEIVLARMMTALGLEFKKVRHYHDEGYESNNNYGLPPQVMRPVHICSVFTTEASFNLAKYKVTPFMPRWPRSLPFHEGVCQHLTFNEMPLLKPEVDSSNEEYLPNADLDDLVWSKEPVPDSQEILAYLQDTQASNPSSVAKSRSSSNPTPTDQSHGDASDSHPHNMIR